MLIHTSMSFFSFSRDGVISHHNPLPRTRQIHHQLVGGGLAVGVVPEYYELPGQRRLCIVGKLNYYITNKYLYINIR